MANYIPKHEREADFKKLDTLILSLEHKADSKDLTVDALRKYQESFNKFNDKYISDPTFGPKDRGIFKPLEFRALIFLAQGDENMADRLLREASDLKHTDESWVSETAKKWEANNATALADIDTENTMQFSGKLEGWLALYTLSFFFAPLFLLFDLFVSGPQFKNEISQISSTAIASDFQTVYNFGIFFDITALIFLGILAFFFFQKMRATKPIAIAFHAFVFIGGFITYWLMSDIATKYSIDLESGSSILTLGSFIWPFYWIFSKRVKATFVN